MHVSGSPSLSASGFQSNVWLKFSLLMQEDAGDEVKPDGPKAEETEES